LEEVYEIDEYGLFARFEIIGVLLCSGELG
jgi:hypothetical protein